jgi:thioredoxin reductase (NADPH)
MVEDNTSPEAQADVAIVGAGPIGLELAAALKRAGVDYVQFEAHQIGHTISWWPHNTCFFSTSERIAIAGIPIQNTRQGRVTGEEYLAYLRGVVELLDLQVNTYERVTRIERGEGGFALHTETLAGKKEYLCQRVVLAKGDMDRPKRLGIPGEDLPHVSHYFRNPHAYFRRRLLVVGGRNSAVEAALRCWRAGSEVTLSYRRAEFDPKFVKATILPDVRTQIRVGNIGFLPESIPTEIAPGQVSLARCVNGQPTAGEPFVHLTDFVLLLTGHVPDMSLLEAVGVNLVGENRVPECDPETMETNVPGLHVAGTTAAGDQRTYRLFIENCHQHVRKILQAITGVELHKVGTIRHRRYDVPLEEIRTN